MIRAATVDDLDGILVLAADRRRQYETYQPRFWRPAADAAQRQRPYLAGLIADPAVIALVAVTTGGALAGMVIGQLAPPPPVYDPGGPGCLVDDFTVADPATWDTVGVDLLTAVIAAARERGAVQIVAVTAALDSPKRAALEQCGLSPASEWWVAPIDT